MNRIKTILKGQGRSQMWLSKQIGKSYVTVTNYANNKTQPNIPMIFAIARVLEVDPTEILKPSKPKNK